MEFGECLAETEMLQKVVSPASPPILLLSPPYPHLRYSLTPVQGKINHIPSTHITGTFIPQEPFSNLENVSVTQDLWKRNFFSWLGPISVPAPDLVHL